MHVERKKETFRRPAMSRRVNVMKLLIATLFLYLMLLINRCDATEGNNEEIKNTSTASTPTSGNNINITKRERSVRISSDSAKGNCVHVFIYSAI